VDQYKQTIEQFKSLISDFEQSELVYLISNELVAYIPEFVLLEFVARHNATPSKG
jgi:hypothetical protein